MYSAFSGNYNASYLSFGYGRSLWAELNGEENSLHWKANMLPLFSIMTLCPQASKTARGLIMSMVGDALLVWHDRELPFLLGMGAFAVAQICYAKGFGFRPANWSRGAGICSSCFLLARVLLSDAPDAFQWLVPCYSLLLATTLWRAVDRYFYSEESSKSRPLLQVLGVLVFVVSDSCIALFKFSLPGTAQGLAQVIILSTYYCAQILIVLGI